MNLLRFNSKRNFYIIHQIITPAYDFGFKHILLNVPFMHEDKNHP